jgi:hypothetical protein
MKPVTDYIDRYVSYAAVAQRKFDVPFLLFDNADLQVFVDGVENTSFTVTADYQEDGNFATNGVVDLGSPVTATVEIYGDRDPRRKRVFSRLQPHDANFIDSLNVELNMLKAEGAEARRDLRNPSKVFGDKLKIDRRTISGMWSDITPDAPPFIQRITDRVFVGAAASGSDARGNFGSWLPLGSSGPGWLPRDSNLTVMATKGLIAISGLSRRSDSGADVDVPGGGACIGVGGAVINDGDQNSHSPSVYPTVWALYGDIQHEPVGDVGSSFGLELAVKNKGSSKLSRPYSMYSTGGAFGLWLNGGGDNRYGGQQTAPPNAGIAFVKSVNTLDPNYTGWNTGIVFASDAITGTDGSAGDTGAAPAIQFGRAQEIQWFSPTNPSVKAAFIRSQVDDSNNSVGIVMSDNGLSIANRGGAAFVKFGYLANAINYFQFYNAAAGAAPQIQALGGDANIGLTLLTKATGLGSLASSTGGTKIGWNNTGVAFNGASPVGKQALSAALSTGGAETNVNICTAINALRTALVNNGLGT